MAFLIVTILACSNAFARVSAPNNSKQCTTINHAASRCLPPVRGQTDTKFCYAYSAARLVSFELCEEVSGAALGLQYSEAVHKSEKIVGRGFTGEALELGAENGFCLEREVASALPDPEGLFDLATAYQEILTAPRFTGCEDDGRMARSRAMFPALNMLEILKVDLSSHLNKVYALASKSCKTKLKADFEYSYCKGSTKEKLDFVNDRLAQRPVELGTGAKKMRNLPSLHAMTVVGRQWNSRKKTCEYVIDDSDARGGLGSRIVVPYADIAKALSDKTVECIAIDRRK